MCSGQVPLLCHWRLLDALPHPCPVVSCPLPRQVHLRQHHSRRSPPTPCHHQRCCTCEATLVQCPDRREKKFNGSWKRCLRAGFPEPVEGVWKGGGIGVLVDPRTGASERTSPGSLRGHATGLRLVGKCLLLLVLLDLALGVGS